MIRHRYPALLVVCLVAPAGSARLAAQCDLPPPAPEPHGVELQEIPPPATKRGAESHLEFYLDALAPLGVADGNAAVYFRDFARGNGRRAEDAKAAIGRRTEIDGRRVLPWDDPLLAEAEPWTRLRRLEFFTTETAGEIVEGNAPLNAIYLIALANTWIKRGTRVGSGEGIEDIRRAVRLGRLLRQDDLLILHDSVRLAILTGGMKAFYDLGQRENDPVTMLLASNAMVEIANARRQDAGTAAIANKIACGYEPDRKRKLPGVSDTDVQILVNNATRRSLARRYRLDVLDGLWMVLHAGTLDQRRIAEQGFRALLEDPDPMIAAVAAAFLELDWDPESPRLTCLKQIG